MSVNPFLYTIIKSKKLNDIEGFLKFLKYNIYRKITRKEFMETIKYYIEKYKLIIFITISLVILLLSLVYMGFRNNKEDEVKPLETNEKVVEEKEEKTLDKVKVDIKGYIKNPGVYELDNNSRVIDVINIAGGLEENANTEYINLSKKIVDEMIIIIYSNSDVEKFKQTDKEVIYIEYECICPDNKNDACINEQDIVNTNGTKVNNKNSTQNVDSKVSINTASLEELMTLSGIGETKAKAIIEYRQNNGLFKKLEELMNVSGIGESSYSKIKDNIKL